MAAFKTPASPDSASIADLRTTITDLIARRQYEAALAASEAAIVDNPTVPGFALLKSAVLLDMKRYDEAVATVGRLIGTGHRVAPAFLIRGHALWRSNRREEAVEDIKRAVAIDPTLRAEQDNLGRMLLLLGDFERGWQQREYRRGVLKPLSCPAPRWAGEDLRGKRILVAAEEGLGDTVMFSRYFDLLRDRGADVTAIIQKELLRLFERSDNLTTWTDDMETSDGFDFQIDLLSLPLLFKTRLETIPAKVPYILAEPKLVDAWSKTIGRQGLKIGIIWEVGKSRYADQRRRIPLSAFAPLGTVPGVRLISLQAVNGLNQFSSLPAGMMVERLGGGIEANPEGIAEIAAAMHCCDLIVTPDTMAAHLAGALARPTWVGLMHDAEWRWLRDRTDSPWYPTMRLFRQPQDGDWPAVITSMRAVLATMLR